MGLIGIISVTMVMQDRSTYDADGSVALPMMYPKYAVILNTESGGSLIYFRSGTLNKFLNTATVET